MYYLFSTADSQTKQPREVQILATGSEGSYIFHMTALCGCYEILVPIVLQEECEWTLNSLLIEPIQVRLPLSGSRKPRMMLHFSAEDSAI